MLDINDNFYRHMGVYGICVVDNCILVIRKILGPYTGKYDLPGGRLEKMESLEQGITREFREETGHTVRKLKNIGVCDFSVIWTLQDNTVENLHHIAIVYEVNVDSEERPNTIESFEGQDSNGAIWLPLDEVTSNNSSPLVLQAIEWIRTGTIPVASGSFDYRNFKSVK
ncbi:NUDIX hydrolase [Paenibacillus sp. FSL H8-0122]|uniref:NUDIX hydrolase n=1 Tax=Paenibacillus sp. FSL H8-0122 TaxID=2954510 RepID=UPI0030FBF94B